MGYYCVGKRHRVCCAVAEGVGGIQYTRERKSKIGCGYNNGDAKKIYTDIKTEVVHTSVGYYCMGKRHRVCCAVALGVYIMGARKRAWVYIMGARKRAWVYIIIGARKRAWVYIMGARKRA